MSKARVAVWKCRPETILHDVERVCELAGMQAALAKGRTTILKTDLAWHFPFPAANTTPWQLEGAVLALRNAGFDDLVGVQNETAVAGAGRDDLNHHAPLFAKHAVPSLSTSRESDMQWTLYRPKARMHVLHKVFPEGIRVPDFFFGKNVVHLPTMKTETFTTTSGAMKSAFGGLLSAQRHRAQSWIHKALVDVLAIQREIHTGLFAVMDGTTAGNGPGPRTMMPVVKDYVLAGEDQVAVDAVAAKMMGFDPLSIDFIALAHQDKLGVGDPRDIEIVGDDAEAVRGQSWGFELGSNGASIIGDALWFGPLKRARKLFFHTPLAKAFVAGSDAYHDHYRWPLKDKRTFENWKRETSWGKLFAAYERGESDRVTRPVRTNNDSNGVQAHL